MVEAKGQREEEGGRRERERGVRLIVGIEIEWMGRSERGREEKRGNQKRD